MTRRHNRPIRPNLLRTAMQTLGILLRHRVTSWRRDPSWGTGTVAGQIVLLALLVLFLFPLGLFGYMLGDALRELYPDANALRLINGGMLYLVPALTASRFFLQSPPSERVAPYVSLPIPQANLLHGQAALSLLSLHTLFAVVLVGPVWAGEVVAALPLVEAAAWLASALLLAVVLPSYGANLLHLLLGRRPRWLFAGLAGLAGLFAVDATLGPDGARAVSRFVFGAPAGGLVVAVLATGATYTALFRTMKARLEVDRRTSRRIGGPSRWGRTIYRWIENTLPAGRLVALELRQIFRTRRLRGLAFMGVLGVIYFYGFSILSSETEKLIDASALVWICFLALPGPTYFLGQWGLGTRAGHANSLFARPHRLTTIMLSHIVVLWIGLIPGTLVTAGVLPWLSLGRAAFLLGMVLFWWGVAVPGIVYLSPHSRTPVDLSESMYTMNTNTHGFRLLPVYVPVLLAPFLASITEAWWTVAGVVGGLGLAGLLGIAWTTAPFARKLDRHRRQMVAGFQENEPI